MNSAIGVANNRDDGSLARELSLQRLALPEVDDRVGVLPHRFGEAGVEPDGLVRPSNAVPCVGAARRQRSWRYLSVCGGRDSRERGEQRGEPEEAGHRATRSAAP